MAVVAFSVFTKAWKEVPLGRLGEPEATLREGLSQIRMAFVELKNRSEDPPTGPEDEASETSQPANDGGSDPSNE